MHPSGLRDKSKENLSVFLHWPPPGLTIEAPPGPRAPERHPPVLALFALLGRAGEFPRALLLFIKQVHREGRVSLHLFTLKQLGYAMRDGTATFLWKTEGKSRGSFPDRLQCTSNQLGRVVHDVHYTCNSNRHAKVPASARESMNGTPREKRSGTCLTLTTHNNRAAPGVNFSAYDICDRTYKSIWPRAERLTSSRGTIYCYKKRNTTRPTQLDAAPKQPNNNPTKPRKQPIPNFRANTPKP